MLLILAGVVLGRSYRPACAGPQDEQRRFNAEIQLKYKCRTNRKRGAFNMSYKNAKQRPTPRSRRFYAHGSFARARDPRRFGVDGRVNVLRRTEKADKNAAKAKVGFRSVNGSYRLHMKKYPGNLQDLIDKPSDAGRRQVGGSVSQGSRCARAIRGTTNTSTLRPASITSRFVRRLVRWTRRSGRHRRRHRQLGKRYRAIVCPRGWMSSLGRRPVMPVAGSLSPRERRQQNATTGHARPLWPDACRALPRADVVGRHRIVRVPRLGGCRAAALTSGGRSFAVDTPRPASRRCSRARRR